MTILARLWCSRQVRHALTERQLLQTVRHPFIVPLHFAFHSETHLYLVLALQARAARCLHGE